MTLSEPVQAAVSRTGEIVDRLVRTLIDELRAAAEPPRTSDGRSHDSRSNISVEECTAANDSSVTEEKGASKSWGERDTDACRNHNNGVSFSRLLLLGMAAGPGTCSSSCPISSATSR